MIDAVQAYFAACNAASRERFAVVLSDDCVHWFPPETGSPYPSRDAIADLWIGFVRGVGSQWTIDRIVCDGNEVCVEWTHFKPKVGERIRGSEWYTFDADGKIDGIWAHYASPRDPQRPANELDGFDYAAREYPLHAPALDAQTIAERARNLAAEPGATEPGTDQASR
ncbi:MAG: nuclear transport factor 2 family protein, partial [Trueperaceae bacterium]